MLATADLIRVGICVAFGLILCGLRLKLVLYVDAIFSIVGGICTYLYATDGLSQYTRGISVDFQHEYLVQFRVILLLMPGLKWLLSQKSMDVTVRTALGVSRLVSCGGAFIVMAISHWNHDCFTNFHLMYSVLPCGLWALVMSVQLVRTGSRVNIKLRRVDVNPFLVADMVVLLLISLPHLILPGFFYGLLIQDFIQLFACVLCLVIVKGLRLDTLHIYLHRVNGAILLGLSSHTWVGQRFRYVEDKHSLLLSRAICCVPWLARTGFACATGQLPMRPATFVYLGTIVSILLPSLFGCILTENGPFTVAFWQANRRTVTMNGQDNLSANVS